MKGWINTPANITNAGNLRAMIVSDLYQLSAPDLTQL
jgi:hypothetical protein